LVLVVVLLLLLLCGHGRVHQGRRVAVGKVAALELVMLVVVLNVELHRKERSGFGVEALLKRHRQSSGQPPR
jgi:hypothetical protein